MKPLFWVALALLSGAFPLHGASGPTSYQVPIESLVDEAIQRPGDGAQICDAPPPVPYSRPPIPAYGLSISQSTFLSEPMTKLLRARRDEVVQELGRRLVKLDLLNPPKAPAKLKKPLLPALYPPAKPDEVDFETETDQNPRTLGGVMLSMVLELDAVELLPHLLRLEEQLQQLNVAADRDEKAPIPVIDAGGSTMWEGAGEDFKDVEDWSKLPPKLKRKQQLFDSMVFDREMLGVMVELLHRKGYASLSTSTLGRIRTLILQHRKLDEDLQKVRSAADIPEDRKRSMAFDKDAGVPYWRWRIVRVPYTEELRKETRDLVQAYLEKKELPALTGAQVLDQAIAQPGDYSQMCGLPCPIAFEVPLPAYGLLAPRHYSVGVDTATKLQAYRVEVMPVLLERLKNIDVAKLAGQAGKPAQRETTIQKSGLNRQALSAPLLETVQAVQGVECLPELLRLEDQLHVLLTAAEKDATAPLPALELDSPVSWNERMVRGMGEPRKEQTYAARIYQREILGLIGHLLRNEDYSPIKNTAVEKAYREGLKKVAAKAELKEFKSADDIPWESRNWVKWDEELNIPVYVRGTVVQVPYTEATREELRKVASDYLTTVPVEKRLGAKVMPVAPEPDGL
ncbi:hypothetical protein DES53_10367 [Roseimicrobium gellanilyticum]|uniref:Uncharacterized protein n=1 Tax=Roseimicrobium gellanilyticum TaxID=748857 RepID=A0A366HNX7_9BACT|nr:hypothetical protein [Roseimicrobium gellanilyticum]RBP45071.1 hypothetical protein DES53_10367 [Roseimicrobium gellanilyticum]